MWLIVVWNGQYSVTALNAVVANATRVSRSCHTTATILAAATPPSPMVKVLLHVVVAEVPSAKRYTILALAMSTRPWADKYTTL